MEQKHKHHEKPAEAPKAEEPKPDAPSAEVAAPKAAAVAPKAIAPLAATATLEDVIAKVNEVIASKPAGKRDRGPDSTRDMTVEDAEAIMLGELKAVNHTDAAKRLGLSYGQVYSARKGFTFKATYQKSPKSW